MCVCVIITIFLINIPYTHTHARIHRCRETAASYCSFIIIVRRRRNADPSRLAASGRAWRSGQPLRVVYIMCRRYIICCIHIRTSNSLRALGFFILGCI